MEYDYPQKRNSRKDKKREKRKYPYKIGGSSRSEKISLISSEESSKKSSKKKKRKK
jgi:hypothetical protein